MENANLTIQVEVIPVPMIMACPSCHARHIDVGEFATKPHHTHACQSCGTCWRPAIVPTVGVQFLPGFKNAEPSTQAATLVPKVESVPPSMTDRVQAGDGAIADTSDTHPLDRFGATEPISPAPDQAGSETCGSQGVDADGHCIRCGLFVDPDLIEDQPPCPPGFLVPVPQPEPAASEPATTCAPCVPLVDPLIPDTDTDRFAELDAAISSLEVHAATCTQAYPSTWPTVLDPAPHAVAIRAAFDRLRGSATCGLCPHDPHEGASSVVRLATRDEVSALWPDWWQRISGDFKDAYDIEGLAKSAANDFACYFIDARDVEIATLKTKLGVVQGHYSALESQNFDLTHEVEALKTAKAQADRIRDLWCENARTAYRERDGAIIKMQLEINAQLGKVAARDLKLRKIAKECECIKNLGQELAARNVAKRILALIEKHQKE